MLSPDYVVESRVQEEPAGQITQPDLTGFKFRLASPK